MTSFPFEDVESVFFDFDDTLYPFKAVEGSTLGVLYRSSAQLQSTDLDPFIAEYNAVRNRVNRDLTNGTFKNTKQGLEEPVLQAGSHNRAIIFGRLLEDRGMSASEMVRLSLKLAEQYEKTFISKMQKHYDRKTTELLDDLGRVGIKRALVTNYTLVPQLRKLVALGIDDRFEAIVTSEEVGADKPDSRIFERALTKLDVSAKNTVMVGDSRTDILGADELGIRTIWFKHPDPGRGVDLGCEDEQLQGAQPTARAADLSVLHTLLLPTHRVAER